MLMPCEATQYSIKRIYRVRQIPFFGKKKTTEYFPKFIFLFESTILPVTNGK